MENTRDLYFMAEALALAQEAAKLGEVPVGAVVVWDDEIVGRGYNLRESAKNALAHAEIIAINDACTRLNGWRLHKATLYVTLEPCPMCAGAIINSRIARVVFGACDPKAGSFGSAADFTLLPYNHFAIIEKGIMEQECSEILKSFFANLRSAKKKQGS